MNRPLVTQIHVLADDESLGLFVRQDGCSRGLGLSHDVGGPRVVQKTVMDAARVPRIHPVGSSKRRVANQRVSPAVVVTGVVMSPVMILLPDQVNYRPRAYEWYLYEARGYVFWRVQLTLAQ